MLLNLFPTSSTPPLLTGRRSAGVALDVVTIYQVILGDVLKECLPGDVRRSLNLNIDVGDDWITHDEGLGLSGSRSSRWLNLLKWIH